MKKAALSLFVALFAVPAFAQTYPVDQGVFIVGGSASLSSRNFKVGTGETERMTTFSLSPDVQYFFVPNLAVGGLFSFSYRNFNGESDSNLFLGPKISYYFGGPDQTLYPFLSGQVIFDVEDAGDNSQLALEGGGAYMIAKNIALTGALFFNAPTDDLAGLNVIGLNFGIRAFAF